MHTRAVVGRLRSLDEPMYATEALKVEIHWYRHRKAGDVDKRGAILLDALHLRKIDLADRVLVVNPRGYIGESTRREIAYARAAGKPVSFTTPFDQ